MSRQHFFLISNKKNFNLNWKNSKKKITVLKIKKKNLEQLFQFFLNVFKKQTLN